MATRAINYLLLMLSFLLFFSVAESFLKLGTKDVPPCTEVGMVEDKDTCSAITQALGLKEKNFGSLNPNLDCDKLFIGQWLCIAGK